MNLAGEILMRRKHEKKQLRQVSNCFSLGFIIWNVVVVTLLLRVSGLRDWLSLNEDLNRDFFYFINMCLPYVIILIILKKDFTATLLLKKPKPNGIAYFWLGLAVTFLASIASQVVVNLLSLMNISSVMPKTLTEYNHTPAGILTFLVSTSIFPAISEEFVFRGFLLGCLRKYGDLFAILASSLIFGLFHANAEQFTFAFLTGTFLGFVFVKTESIYISALIHFANNLRSCLNVILCDSTGVPAISLIILICSSLPGVAAYFKLRKQNKQALSFSKLKKGKTVLMSNEKWANFIFAPGMIILLILLAYTMVNSVQMVNAA